MTQGPTPLVRPMFDGPVDLVGDVHGEIEALRDLLRHLGYDETGNHPEGRRLVFVGDLVDRGPDTPAVLELVTAMMEAGNAQCVMGNHELNILRGKRNGDNAWFHGEVPSGKPNGQVLLEPARREDVEAFIHGLPLALERADLRAVHACWDDESIDQLRGADRALDLYEEIRRKIDAEHERRGTKRSIEHEMDTQNRNPVKVVTSGFERKADKPFEAGGKLRQLERHDWWRDYGAPGLCVFGHYSRKDVPGKSYGPEIFKQDGLFTLLGKCNSICIDYSVGARSHIRNGNGNPSEVWLGALRWPEGVVTLDDGRSIKIN